MPENVTPPRPLPTQTPEQAAEIERLIREKGPENLLTVDQIMDMCKDMQLSDEESELFDQALREARGKE